MSASVRERVDALASQLRRLIDDGRASRANESLQRRAGVIARALTTRTLLSDAELEELAAQATAVVVELRALV